MNFYGNRILHEERLRDLEYEQATYKPRQVNRFANVPTVIGDLLIHIGASIQKHAEVK